MANKYDRQTHNEYRRKFQELIEQYGIEKITKIIDTFTSKEKEIFILHYGINYKPHTQKEIAQKFRVSFHYVSHIAKTRLDELSQMLENENIKYAYTKKDKFYQLFPDFSIKEINEALNASKERNKNIVIDYYGLKSPSTLTQEQLASKYNLSRNFIIRIIKDTIEKTRQTLNNHSEYNLKFEEKYTNYSKEDIELALLTLPSEHRDIFKTIYQSNPNQKKAKEIEMCQKYNMKKNSLNTLLARTNKKIIETLNNMSKYEICFPTFDDPNIDKIKSKLTPNDLILINLYSESKTSKEFLKNVCINYNIVPQKAIEFAKFCENNVAKEIKKYNNRISEFKNFFDHHTQNDIKDAFFMLGERERNIIYMYYGLNGYNYSTMQEIGDNYGLTRARINEIIKYNLRKMKLMLENPKKLNEEKEKKQSISRFNHYSQKEIDFALIKFSLKNQDILKMKFGLKGNMPYSENEISQKYGMPIDSIKEIIKISSSSLENILTNKTILDLNPKIVSLLKIYGLENFMKIVESLDESDKRIFCMHHGICGCQKHSLEKLSLHERIDDRELYVTINCIYETLESKLLLQEENSLILQRQEELKNKLSSKDKSKLKKAFKFLTIDELKILNIYYNLDGKHFFDIPQICKMFDIDENKLQQSLEEIINKINYHISINNSSAKIKP